MINRAFGAVCGIIEDSHLGVQTVRRGGVGPVRSLLGGKPHRPLFLDSPLETLKEVVLCFSAKCGRRKPGNFFDASLRVGQVGRGGVLALGEDEVQD